MRWPNLTSRVFLVSSCLALFACASEEKEVTEPMEPQGVEQAAEPEEGNLEQALEDQEGELGSPQEELVSPPGPAPSYHPSERVVRFVKEDQTLAYQQADMMGPVAGKYRRGDPLVVKWEGDWAQITDNFFIRSSSLSPKVVPRHPNPNDWMIQSVTVTAKP